MGICYSIKVFPFFLYLFLMLSLTEFDATSCTHNPMCSIKGDLSFPPEYYQSGDLVIGGLVSHLFSPGGFASFNEFPETKFTDEPA